MIKDYKNLVWLKSNDTSSKLTRWSLVLDEIAIKSWTHAPGSEMGVEDGLSRGGGEDPAPVSEMSERERILLEEEDIQSWALRALCTRVSAVREPEEDEGWHTDVLIDMEAEAEVLLSTLVALRQAWLATSASGTSSRATKTPSAAASAAAEPCFSDDGETSPIARTRPPVSQRLGAKAERNTPAFILGGEERRAGLRSQATSINARAAMQAVAGTGGVGDA